jgi:SagB-type dehydrogenase family enzyme
MPVHRAIRVRRSAARFLDRPIARQDLERILAFASHTSAAAVGRDLSFRVVAHRVTGLPPGVYSLDPFGGALEAQREGPLADALVDACLGQAKSGEAAVAVVAVARLAEATARGEARRYRDLLLAAGAAAQRLYLGAEAHGLAARNLAAYYDDELDALLGLDGEREVSLHLTAVGAGD